MTTTYGYARVSTDDQVLDLQVDALRRAGCVEIVSDDGVSGADFTRPGLVGLLARVTRGDTIVAYSLSRIGRSTVDVLGVLRDLERRGVAFRSVTEHIDTSTAAGRLLITVLAAVAQFERDVAVERIRAGMTAARERGTHVGRPKEYSPEQLATLRAGIESGLTVPLAAERAEMTYRQARRALAR